MLHTFFTEWRVRPCSCRRHTAITALAPIAVSTKFETLKSRSGKRVEDGLPKGRKRGSDVHVLPRELYEYMVTGKSKVINSTLEHQRYANSVASKFPGNLGINKLQSTSLQPSTFVAALASGVRD